MTRLAVDGSCKSARVAVCDSLPEAYQLTGEIPEAKSGQIRNGQVYAFLYC
jgi:hypothetical protein